jgi:hypothetical protein
MFMSFREGGRGTGRPQWQTRGLLQVPCNPVCRRRCRPSGPGKSATCTCRNRRCERGLRNPAECCPVSGLCSRQQHNFIKFVRGGLEGGGVVADRTHSMVWLPVHDAFLVEEFESGDDFSGVETSPVLLEAATLLDVEHQVTTV